MLTDMFGDSALVKVLDFLLDEWESDFSIVEAAKEAGLTWKSASQVFPVLEKRGLIKKSRQIGRATMYKLIPTTPLFLSLKKIDFIISSKTNSKIIEKQVEKAAISVFHKKGTI